MTHPRSPITVLWNTGAGWDEGEKEGEIVRNILSGVAPDTRFELIKKGDNFLQKCQQAVDGGSEILVAAGGDGTINAVASSAVATGKTLGVIPAGTLNHFARDLEISLDPKAAAEQFRDGHEIQVDVGSVNGRIFINNSVLGVYPVYWVARQELESYGLGSTRLGRFFAVLGGIIRVFWRMPHVTLNFVTDSGAPKRMRTPFVLVANNEHELEDWRIGHRSALDEGYLWVYVMRKCSRWAVLRYFTSFIFKRFSKNDAFEVFKVKELRIESKRRKIRVGVDGEVLKMNTPLEYCSRPQALRVIAPITYRPQPALPAPLAEGN